MTARDPAERGRRADRIRREAWADGSSGWIMATELLTGTLVWGGIGWLLDRWLQTGPWFMAVGMLLGWGAALYLIYLRSEGRLAAPDAAGRAQPAAPDQTPHDHTPRGPR